MKTYQFKTNIKCGGCMAQVTPHFSNNNEIKNWNVDINNPDKILTVETEQLSESDVTQIVEKAGYKAESLQQ